MLYFHPAGLDVVMVVYHLLYDLLMFFSVWVGGLGWWAGESSKRRVHSMISGGFMIISTAQSQFSKWSPVIWSLNIRL
jgi:hypothetical protein